MLKRLRNWFFWKLTDDVYDDGIVDGIKLGRRLERAELIVLLGKEFDTLSELGAESEYLLGLEHGQLLLKTTELD